VFDTLNTDQAVKSPDTTRRRISRATCIAPGSRSSPRELRLAGVRRRADDADLGCRAARGPAATTASRRRRTGIGQFDSAHGARAATGEHR
jgi:hypothetical protein